MEDPIKKLHKINGLMDAVYSIADLEKSIQGIHGCIFLSQAFKNPFSLF
jgi:hypothetical protein